MNNSPDKIHYGEPEDEFSSNYPRLFDLYQHSDKSSPNNYFNDMSFFSRGAICAPVYRQIEDTLAKLDYAAWEALRTKTLPSVIFNHKLRNHQQLISALNEARGYTFLAKQGYKAIRFIEIKTTKKNQPESPDLFARKDDSVALLEVKTIHESNDSLSDNAPWRSQAVKVPQELSQEFKGKLLSTIQKAIGQLKDYPEPSDRKIVLLVVCFDMGQKTSHHSYLELADFVASQSMKDGIEVYHEVAL